MASRLSKLLTSELVGSRMRYSRLLPTELTLPSAAIRSIGFACAFTIVACGSSSPASPPDANADVNADAEASDSTADQRRGDGSHPDGTGGPSSPDGEPADGLADDRGLDGRPTDSRDAQTTQDGSTCGNLANTASPIAATLVTSISRSAAGGALTDGTYELVSAEETFSSAPAKFWRTFQISNSGTAFEWIIQDIGLSHEHFAGGLSVMGTSLVMTDRCLGGMLDYPYDAQGADLTLYFLFGGPTAGRVFHYRARTAP
jgi:hypothetical protein